MTRAAFVAMLFASTSAFADTARLEVTSDACALDGVRERAADLLGAPAIADHAPALIRVEVESAPTLRARVTYVDAGGALLPARTVEAAACADLVDSVALIISIIVRDESPAPRPPVEPVEQLEAESAPPVPPRRPPSLAGWLEVSAAGGTAGSFEGSIGGRIQRGARSVALDIAVTAPTDRDLGDMASASISSARAQVAGCFHRGAFAACGLFGAGWIRGRGNGLMDARTAYAPLATAGVRLEWRAMITERLGARMFFDGEQLLTTTHFLVDDVRVWSSEPRQLWAGAGAFLRWP